MLMHLGELGTAAERGLPIVVVVFNDSALSLIKLKQRRAKLERRGVDFGETRFDTLGRGFGAEGVRVETIEAFEKGFRLAMTERRFTVIDAVVDPTEYLDQM